MRYIIKDWQDIPLIYQGNPADSFLAANDILNQHVIAQMAIAGCPWDLKDHPNEWKDEFYEIKDEYHIDIID